MGCGAASNGLESVVGAETDSSSARAQVISDVLDHLNAYTMALSKELGRVICITGTAYDRDLDGVADSNKTFVLRREDSRQLPRTALAFSADPPPICTEC